MRILLTGSSGRIGRNLLLDGLADRHRVTAFDWAPPPTRLDNVRYVAGSILDRKDLSDAMQGAEAVIHLAAIPYDIPPLHQVFQINVQGTYHALELAVEHGARHFLHASSLMGTCTRLASLSSANSSSFGRSTGSSRSGKTPPPVRSSLPEAVATCSMFVSSSATGVPS